MKFVYLYMVKLKTMKRKRLILIAIWAVLFLFFTTFSGYSQISDNWTPLDSEMTQNLRVISAFNADTIFFLTDEGKIITTFDGLHTARERNPQVGREIKINALRVNSRLKTVIAVGDSGAIFRTENMGESWEQIIMPGVNMEQWNLKSITDDGDNYEERFVYATGDKGLVLKSVDDGINWEKLTLNVASGQDFKTITFLNPDTGFVANENGIVRTFDGGKSWKVISTESNTAALKIADLKKLADELVNVSMSSEGGGIQTSVDYGQTWKSAEFNSPCDLLNTGGILFDFYQCEALYNGGVVESYSGWVGSNQWNILSGNEFSGVVIPKFNEMPLGGVPVVMRKKDDQSVVAETTTDSHGRFWFDIPLSVSGIFEISEQESWERQYCLVPLKGDTLPPWNPDQDCDAFKIELNIIDPTPVDLHGLTINGNTWIVVGQGGVVLATDPEDADGDGYGDLWSRQISRTNDDLYAVTALGIEKSDIRRGFAVGNAGSVISAQKPELEVLSPTGTDSICAGNEITIEWTGGDPTWNLLISVVDINSSNVIANITAGTPNDGSEIWSVPAGFPPGLYKIYIQEVNNESWVYSQPFVVHHCPEPPVCLETCANNLLQNWNFNQNAVFGPMPAGSVANWASGGSPDVSTTQCSVSDTVSIGMWGNQVTGENMWQNLATPFVPGKTYSISFSGKWVYANNTNPYPVQFEFRTTNAIYANNTLIGVSDPLTSPGTWVTVTLPDWTATGSASDPFSTLIVKATNQSSFFHADSTSYGYITAICVSEIPVTGLTDNPKISDFKLANSFPNPFSHSTTIHYSVPSNEKVAIKIFNVNGMVVESLVNEVKSAGEHQIEWQPAGIPGGIYFCRMQAGDSIETIKIVFQEN